MEISRKLNMNLMTDEKILKDLYTNMYQAMIRKDPVRLDEVLDDDFVLIHMTGMRQPKDEFVKAVLDGTLNYFSELTDDVKVTVTDDIATVIGKSQVNAAVFGGGRHTWRLEQGLICKKTDDGWKIAKSVASTY